MDLVDYTLRRLFDCPAPASTPSVRELLAMRPAMRRVHLETAAAAMQAQYQADADLPVSDRELTAFTALDGEAVVEHG
jgi:hypothetical protein